MADAIRCRYCGSDGAVDAAGRRTRIPFVAADGGDANGCCAAWDPRAMPGGYVPQDRSGVDLGGGDGVVECRRIGSVLSCLGGRSAVWVPIGLALPLAPAERAS